MNQVIQTADQHYYLPKLLGYDYIISYKPSKNNKVADALFRQAPHIQNYLSFHLLLLIFFYSSN